MTRRRLEAVLIMILVLSSAIGCSSGEDRPGALNVGVLPDQDEGRMHPTYDPLLEHIESEAGVHCTLKIPASYEQLLHWFYDGTVDLALFGGGTYVMAHREAGAIPLVLRDVDGRFSSVILVPAGSMAKTLQDLENRSFAFGPRLSTSGHLMPRYFFKKNNIVPETFFRELTYSGAHDRTAEWVRDGRVEAGVANSDIVHEMYLDGRLRIENTRVLWESPPYADYVWAIQPSIDESIRARIRDAFLLLDERDPVQADVLRRLGAGHYLPARHEDFLLIEQIVLEVEN